MKIVVLTLGCKVNQCESDEIITSLSAEGYEVSDTLSKADFYIVNTCSVTAEADRKSLQVIAKIRKFGDQPILVIGCSSENSDERFLRKGDNIYTCGNGNKIENAINSVKYYDTHSNMCEKCIKTPIESTFCGVSLSKSSRTRGHLKIQDGCNNFCSYCIIPYLRGRNRSLSLDKVVAEAYEQSKLTKEIVLTGIDLSSYGKDIGCDLPTLVDALKDIPVRFRLGSLECSVVNEQLLQSMKSANFCPHFHLSLQSGSNLVLKSMNRHYTTAQYKDKVDLIRGVFPNAGITTDVIVGFPTETDHEFSVSEKFVRECEFSDIHCFKYSPRKGTRAYGMIPLPSQTLSERMKVMLTVKQDTKLNFLKKQNNTIHAVYTETQEDGFSVGYTENYVKTFSRAPLGSIVNMRLTMPFKDGVLAEEIEK